MILIYGRKKAYINIGEINIKCPSCESHNWADMMVYSYYYHIFWVPIFPFDKEASVACQKCGLRRHELSFSERLISNFDEIKDKYRHPWYTYIGIGAFTLLIVLVVLAALLPK